MDLAFINELTEEELNELLNAVMAKLDQIANPVETEELEGDGGETEAAPEVPEAAAEVLEEIGQDLDKLEELVEAIEGRKAAIKNAAEKRAALIRRVAGSAKTRKPMIEPKKEDNKMDQKELYRSAWLKNLQGKDITAEERTALAGGNYVIPQETVNKIYGKMELYPLLNAIDVMHIPGTVVLPVEGTVNDAGVVAMGNAATDAADTVTSVSLGVYKIIKTVEITADVAAMAIPAFEDWLVDRLANKIYRSVTKYVAAGTGSSQPTGLATITATGNTYTKAGITYDDMLAIIAKLATEWLPNATFVMSRTTFWQNVMAIKDGDQRPIVVADAQSPAKFNVFGFPIILEDEIGTDIIFGDLKEGYVWNFGKDIAVDRDESVGFRAGSTVFRGMCLGDGKPTGVGLVRYTKAAS